MALTQVPIELSSTPGIVDNSNATAITIDSSENVLVGTTTHRNFSGGTTEITVGTATTGATAGGAITFDSGSGFLGYLAFQESEGTLGTLTSVPLVFKTGNTERLRIDSSGNVMINATALASGLGGVAPQMVLKQGATNSSGIMVETSANDSLIRMYHNGSAGILSSSYGSTGAYHPLVLETGGSERMRIDSNGNLLLGRTSRLTGQTESISSDTVMSVHGVLASHQTACGVMQYTADGFILRAYGATAGTGNIQFLVGGGGGGADFEAMRIDSSGNLLVGGTSLGQDDSAGFTAGGVLTIARASGVNRNMILFKNAGSQVGSITTTTSATSYNTSSDYRLKDNVVALTGATERLKQLNPSRFNFIADADVTVDGFLAHEVADVVPEAISGTKDAVDDDGNAVYQGIDQSKLVPLLVATIQELEARITQLENN